MELEELCKRCDQYEIVDTQKDIDKEYWASYDAILSDGEIEKNINREGYIHITSVTNAAYIIFLDRNKKIYACIHRNILSTNFKDIIDHIALLREHIKELDEESSEDKSDTIDTSPEGHLYDINTFKCTECPSKAKLIYKRVGNADTIETKCAECHARYRFVPSKWYSMSSKTIVYHINNDSRTASITNPIKNDNAKDSKTT